MGTQMYLHHSNIKTWNLVFIFSFLGHLIPLFFFCNNNNNGMVWGQKSNVQYMSRTWHNNNNKCELIKEQRNHKRMRIIYGTSIIKSWKFRALGIMFFLLFEQKIIWKVGILSFLVDPWWHKSYVSPLDS